MAPRAAKKKGKTLEIVQVRSGICTPENHKRTLKALGFSRLNQKVTRPDNPAIRGMVDTIPHLVRIVSE
ncbi:MAG: 50S ribosomal protein L30 [Acidobacteria bacterium]|jgi:large subunit ribosomal protein L30|nr:50S ribosomal protein L30 [Acidobacteriota bacterium]MCI0567860.1 50S ribosomal protein L30 [Acidobacteriota bacterium]MCI0657133.1 50S ribosomal protein L30 [Acidobacteriota bacterium]